MTKKLTRAERYKRNYGLIRNSYQNSVLAKRGQTWSDERIYKELGIKVTSKKTPILKKIDSKKQAYYDRKFDKFIYARSIGIEVKTAKRLTRYKKEKIDTSAAYHDAKSKKFNFQNKNRRIALWKKWSKRNINKEGKFDRTISNMPPEIETAARKYNRESIVAYKPRDDYDAYGYVVAFYMFVENKSFEDVKLLLDPDFHDATNIYKTTVRA